MAILWGLAVLTALKAYKMLIFSTVMI